MTAPHVLLANVFFAPFTYGGATIVAEQVARHLVQDFGVRVTVVSACHRSDLAAYAVIKSEVDGITNYLINLPHNRSYADLYDAPQVTQIIAGLMDQLQPDVLHAHCVQDLGVGMFAAAKDRGIPTILSVHDFWWLCDRQFMLRPDQTYCGQFPVQIEACKGCVESFSAAKTRFLHLGRVGDMVDVVTYPSAFARDLSEASGFGVGKGVVWPNGVGLPGQDFFDRRKARRAKDPRVSFGFVGGPSHIKGWPLIRQAFTDIDQDDFKGYLVDGSIDGSWWTPKMYGSMKGDWKIYPRFSQDDMDAFYAEIDVLLFLSQWKETFGLTIREALARGIRIIQTDSGGTTEHGHANPQDLIPIGAGSDAVLSQIKTVLAQDTAALQQPLKVTAFSEQTAALHKLLAPLLAS